VDPRLPSVGKSGGTERRRRSQYGHAADPPRRGWPRRIRVDRPV